MWEQVLFSQQNYQMLSKGEEDKSMGPGSFATPELITADCGEASELSRTEQERFSQ